MSQMSGSPISLSVPVLGGNEGTYLADCVETELVSSVGPYVDRFEAAITELTGAPAAVAVSSGTAALQLSLIALGLSPGGEVWVPSLTFIATANAVVHAGGRPLFVDVAPDALNMDPDLVTRELTRRLHTGENLPAAIVPVHLYGEPDLLPWLDLANDAGVPVIEDAAESVGSRWSRGPLAGCHTGTAGDLGVFSFNGNKIITAGGGGVVIGEPPLIDRIRHLSTQARIPGTDYEHDEIGFNHRLTNLCAAVGLAQLERLGQLVDARRIIHRRYVNAFEDDDSVTCIRWSADSNCWLTVVSFRDREHRDWARTRLLRDGIQVRNVWPPLETQRPYSASARMGSENHAMRWAETGLCLPSSSNLQPDDLQRVVKLVRRRDRPSENGR